MSADTNVFSWIVKHAKYDKSFAKISMNDEVLADFGKELDELDLKGEGEEVVDGLFPNFMKRIAEKLGKEININVINVGSQMKDPNIGVIEAGTAFFKGKLTPEDIEQIKEYASKLVQEVEKSQLENLDIEKIF